MVWLADQRFASVPVDPPYDLMLYPVESRLSSTAR
jgi:hypothetical protein